MRSSGFTLIEVLFAIFISTIAIYGISLVVEFSMKGLRGVEKSVDVLEMHSHLRKALTNPNLCKNNFQNMVLVAPGKIQLSKIQYFSPSGRPTGTIITKNEKRDGLQVKELWLNVLSEIADNQIVAELNFSLAKTGISPGPQEFTRTIPVLFTVSSANRVIDCSTDLYAGVSFFEKICEIQSAGRQRYDVAQGICIDRYMAACVGQGSPYVGTCPAGQVLVPGDDKVACHVRPPTGFSDLPIVRSPLRAYVGAGPRDAAPPPAFAVSDRLTNKCSCIYAVGINPAGWECQTCCESQVPP